MSGVQTTFGGVCGAKKDGLALHFGLESAKTKNQNDFFDELKKIINITNKKICLSESLTPPPCNINLDVKNKITNANKEKKIFLI